MGSIKGMKEVKLWRTVNLRMGRTGERFRRKMMGLI